MAVDVFCNRAAALVAEVAVVAVPAVATDKFATCVVEVTTNGAVPVATFEINWGAVTFAVASTCAVPKLLTLAFPVAFNVPEIFAPVPVTTRVVLPTAVKLIFPFAVGILTFELPFACEPVNVVAVMVFDAKFAVIPVTILSALLPLLDEVTPARYTVELVEVLVCTAAALVAEVALVAVPLNAPTNVVAVIELLLKLALIPVLITADELPFALEVVNARYTVVAVDVF